MVIGVSHCSSGPSKVEATAGFRGDGRSRAHKEWAHSASQVAAGPCHRHSSRKRWHHPHGRSAQGHHDSSPPHRQGRTPPPCWIGSVHRFDEGGRNVQDSTHSYTTLRASPYSDGIIHSRESRTTQRSPRVFLSAPPTTKARADGAPLRWAATLSARRPRETATQKKAIYPLRLLSSGVEIAIFQERTTSRFHNPKCMPQARRSPSIKLQFFFTRKFSIFESAVHDPSRNLTSQLFTRFKANNNAAHGHSGKRSSTLSPQFPFGFSLGLIVDSTCNNLE